MRKYHLGSRAEKYLLGVIMVGLGLLLAYHFLVAGLPFNQVINQVGSDAQTVTVSAEVPRSSLILQLVNFSSMPRVKVLVNGKVKADFSHPYVTIPVAAGDTVEIDTAFYRHEVKIKVLDTSDNVVYPKKGVEITACQTVVSLGQVKLLSTEKQ